MGFSLVLVFFSSLSFAHSNTSTLSTSCTLSNFVEALPQDTTVECSNIPNPAVLTAVDSCGNNVNVVFKETNNDDGSCADYTIVREWSACGPSGNVIKHIQTITVRDTVAPYFIQDLPTDLTLQCTDTVPDAVTLTAADACDPSVCIVRFEEEISGQDDGCNSNYVITRTWKVNDCAGNENVHVQTVSIEDNEAPDFQQDLPESYTLDCTADIPDAETLTARDSCDSSVCAVNFNEITIGKDDGCDAEYQLKRIWKTTDCAGNENQHIQIITIEDNTPPSFVQNLPEDATFECDADIPDAPTITAVDSCDSSVCVVDFNEVVMGKDDDCPSTFKIVRTWTTKDCADNSVSHTQTLTFEDTTAPEFVETLPVDIEVGCTDIPDAVVLTAIDNCDTNLADITFEEIIFNKDDECDTDYVIKRVWKVADCATNELMHTQRITVTGGDPNFVESLPADIEVSCESIPTAETLTAMDGCGNMLTVNFEESSTADDTTCGDYTITRIWKAQACDSELMHTQTITVTAPTISFNETLPENVTVSCTEIPVVNTLTATDSCGDSIPVIFEETNSATANGCETYTITRIWKTDVCVDTDITHTQLITVEPVDNASFNESLPVDETIECADAPSPITLTAVDACGNAIDVVFEESSNQTDSCSSYTLTRTWTAAYCGDSSISHTQTITINTGESSFNEALPDDTEVECASIPDPTTLTAVDGCGNTINVDFEETSTRIDDCTSYTITRVWSAANCNNQTLAHSQTITVNPGEGAFVEATLPGNTEIQCEDLPDPVVLTATDGCGNEIDVVFEETSDQTDNCSNYTVTRSWTATYCGDKVLSHVQTLSVTSGQTSFVEELPTDETIECGDPDAAATLTATDGCGNPVEVAFEETSDQDENNDCPLYLITRTWTAIDCDGSEISHTQIISVGDTVAPTVVETIENIDLVCGQDVPPAPDLTFEDNCTATENLIVDFNEDQQTDNGNTIITRTWEVTDTCDNAASFSQVITITEPETNAQSIENCADDGVLDFTTLFEDALVGTWEDLDDSGALSGNMFDTSGVQDGNYRFRLIDDITNCTTGKEVTVIINSEPCEVLPCRLEDIEISEVVTPNGDGINEFFVIDGVEGCGFIVQVKIFNRLGQLVFESNDYQNDWSGQELGNDQLPSGTYFYIVKLVNSGFDDIQGFIFLGSGV